MSRTVRIRLGGLAAGDGVNKEAIERQSGYSLARDGDDWVVYDDDPQLTKRTNCLVLHPEGLPLHEHSYSDVAKECLLYLNSTFETKPTHIPPELRVSSGLGLISDLDQSLNRYFWTNKDALRKELQTKIFPGMVKLGATHVYPLSFDAQAFYRSIALPKISYISKRHGFELVRDKVINERVLDAALPSPLQPLNSLDSLLFVPPFAVAIPLHRVGSGLLFTANGIWQFPRILAGNVFDLLDLTAEPFSSNSLDAVLRNRDVSRQIVDSYLRLAISSINNLTAFICSPLNFLDANGEFDELRQLKASSLVRLLVADAKAINATNSFHGKSRFVFQFIDKLANLSVEMSQPGLSGKARSQIETEETNRFYLPGIFKELKSVLGYHGRIQDERLGALLKKVVSRVENRYLSQVSSVFRKAGKTVSDIELIRYFRTLRNLGHGTYLGRDQFENLFLEVNPIIPTEYTYLPWLTLLALGLSPERILGINQ